MATRKDEIQARILYLEASKMRSALAMQNATKQLVILKAELAFLESEES